MIHGIKDIPRRLVVLLLSLFGVGVSFLNGQGVAPPPTSPSVPPLGNARGSVNPATGPFEQILVWLTDARRNFTAVQDYTCMLTKRENVNGVRVRPNGLVNAAYLK